MGAYLILGAGHFGRLALLRLAAAAEAASFTILDHRPEALATAEALGIPRLRPVQAEAIPWLAANLPGETAWDWIIPMVPEHVAVGWLRRNRCCPGDWEPVYVPDEVAGLAPVAHRGREGELYLSRAAHLCPDDCLEPEDVCPVTGESRRPALFEALAAQVLPGVTVTVIPSRQLAPGVGGFAPKELLEAAGRLAEGRDLALVATACRCHGVAHMLKRRSTGP